MTTTEEIIEIISKHARPGATITETSHLYEDLWVSTDDFAAIAEEIHDKFGERISTEDFRSGRVSSVRDIVEYVNSQDWGSRTFSGCDDDDDTPEEIDPKAYEKQEELAQFEKRLSFAAIVIIVVALVASNLNPFAMVIAALILRYVAKYIIKIIVKIRKLRG